MRQHKADTVSELQAFSRFLLGLPRLVRLRMTVDQALAIVRDRLRSRERNFLAVVERSVFGTPGQPVPTAARHGRLHSGGPPRVGRARRTRVHAGAHSPGRVYVSFEEFKGLAPIVRGSTTIHATPADFDNPTAGRYYSTTTGGSTGVGRRIRLDLEYLESSLPGRIMVRHVQGITGIPAASWSDLPPAGGLMGTLLHAAAGQEATHWFCTRPLRGPGGAALRYRLATTAALTVARAAGASVQPPRYLPFDQAIVLAEWARDQVRRHGACTVHSSVSRILRVAVAAHEAGIDLTGTVLRGGGEPPTVAKVSQITRTGARFFGSYAFSEVGTVGSPCLNPTGPNDQHFMQDHLAVIQASRPVPGFGIEVPSFLFTSLLPSAPKLMLNVESDDYGAVDQRPAAAPGRSSAFPCTCGRSAASGS